MNLEMLRTRLHRLRCRTPGGMAAIAKDSGISLSWLEKFVCGLLHNPTLRRIEQLQRYLSTHPPPTEDRTE